MANCCIFICLLLSTSQITFSQPLQCPTKCRCYHEHGGITVHCDAPLREFPTNFPPNVSTLFLYHTYISYFRQSQFTSLQALKSLTLAHNMQKGASSVIFESGTFNISTNIQDLVLHKTGADNFPTDLLSPLGNLKHLDISFNNIGLRNAIAVFKQIRSQSVNYLDMTATVINELGILNLDFFRALSPLNLKTLKLNQNRIISISPGFHTLIPTIEVLSLHRNNILGGRAALVDFFLLQQLKLLDVSDQEGKRTKRSPNAIMTKAREKCQYIITLPPRLEWLSIRNNRFKGLSINYCAKSPSLKYVDLSYIDGHRIDGKLFLSTPNLEYVNIQSSLLVYVNPETFLSCVHLKTLLLGGNALNNAVHSDKGILFRNITALQTLDLARNSIKYLNADTFKSLSRLELLNLSGNSLMSINVHALNVLPNLKYLNLSFNKFAHISKVLRQWLDTHGNVSVDLTYNPFVCNCTLLSFLEWFIHGKKAQLWKKETYVCDLNGNRVNMADVQVKLFIEDCKERARDKHIFVFIVNGVLLGLITCVATAASFVYRFRWRLRYFWYVEHHFWQGRGEVQNMGYQYNCYNAYGDGDSGWLDDTFQPEMENNRNYTTCIPSRDFLAGCMFDNIGRSIDSSRKVILLLSPNLFNSDFWRFEIEMAFIRMNQIDQNVIIMIKLEDFLDQCPADCEALRSLIQAKPPLEWPVDEEGRRYFWERLAADLGPPINPPQGENPRDMPNDEQEEQAPPEEP